jgi:glucose/arabinose dehydrogenase
LFLLTAPSLGLARDPQDAEPGLVAEYFALDAPPQGFPSVPAGRKPTFVRVEPTINHAFITGEFHGTKLDENFFVRWTGLLRCPEDGLYNFYVESDDGCRLYIDQELAVDNSDGRAMEQHADRLTLKAGTHAIHFEYFQGAGPAGVNLQWKMPRGGRLILPAAFLSHASGAEKIEWDREAWEKRPAPPPMQPAAVVKPGRYALTDYGPFLSRSLGPANAPIALTGHLLRLSNDSFVCFDPRLLRVAAAWTGGFLSWPTEKDGVAGLPNVAGKLSFRNPAIPGWGDEKDPRSFPGSPLPRERGHWRGLYLHGKDAVLSYTVGGAEVLELHGMENGAFTRTIEIKNLAAPIGVLVAPAGSDAGVLGEGAALVRRGENLVLEVRHSSRFKIAIPNRTVAAPEPLEPLTRGGAPRWPEPVVTRGTLGKEPGAWQVDTLTVPYENPSNSYMRIVALDFFPDGRAAVATLDGDVWIVSGIDEKLETLTWKRFATGLYQPLGLRIVDGAIYALGRDQVTRLHDLNGDGEADFYENFNNDCLLGTSYGEYAMDLQVGPDGDFFYTKAGTMGYGSATPHSGCVLRLSKDGSTLEVFAVGFRAPMGLCVGPDGFITATDQQGNYMAECPIVRVRKGGSYGFVLEHHPETKTQAREPAISWLPMDVDNSSGGQVWVTGDRWGPLRGRLLHTSYGQSKLLLTVLDEAREQGGVVRFPLQFASGIMRAQFNPADGQLYVAGLRGWQTTAAKEGCLQRVRYTGKPALLPVSMKIRKTGIDLTFTDALDAETAGDPDSYSALWFNVVSTPDYGSPEFNATNPAKRGREKVAVTAAKLLADGKTVSLDLEGFRPVTNLIVKFSIRSAAGAKIHSEVFLTVNRLPDDPK